MKNEWMLNTINDLRNYCKLNRYHMLGAILKKAEPALLFDIKNSDELQTEKTKWKPESNTLH